MALTDPTQQTTSTPEEDRLKAIDAELERKSAAHNLVTSGPAHWIWQDDKVGTIRGAGYDQELASYRDPIWQNDWLRSDAGRNLREKMDTQYASILAGRIGGDITNLTKERAALMGAAIDKRLVGIKAKEDAFRTDLTGKAGTFNTALTNQLDQSLQAAGIKADDGRAQVGEAIASRGLGRSTMGTQAVNSVTEAELQDKAGIRSNADQIRTNVNKVVDDSLKGIEAKRQAMSVKRDLAELRSYDDVAFHMDTASLQSKIQDEMTKMKIDAASDQFLSGAIGGILGGITSIFAGGKK